MEQRSLKRNRNREKTSKKAKYTYRVAEKRKQKKQNKKWKNCDMKIEKCAHNMKVTKQKIYNM